MAATTGFAVPRKKVQRDADGYTLSFPVDDEQGIRDFFDEFGFVVVSDVFSPQQCEDTIDDIWRVLDDMTGGRADRTDQQTWTNEIWNRTGIQSEGMVGGSSLFTKRILLNRQSPKLVAAFALLLGTEELLSNHDRYGFFRPAKMFPERATQQNLHLDMNPWSYFEDQDNAYQIKVLSSLKYRSSLDWIVENNEPGCAAVNELHLQGMVNLEDNREEDGGFWLVPGFRDCIQNWAQASEERLRRHYGARGTFCVLLKISEHELYALGVRITARAGSAIIWDQRTLHGSCPNRSLNARYAQFFKFFPINHPAMTADRADNRQKALRAKCIKAGLDVDRDLTPLGRKVFFGSSG